MPNAFSKICTGRWHDVNILSIYAILCKRVLINKYHLHYIFTSEQQTSEENPEHISGGTY